MKTLLIALLCVISSICYSQRTMKSNRVAKDPSNGLTTNFVTWNESKKSDTLTATILISPTVEKTMLARDKAIGEMQQKIKEFQQLNHADYNASIEYYNLSKAPDSVFRKNIIEAQYIPGKFVIKFKK